MKHTITQTREYSTYDYTSYSTVINIWHIGCIIFIVSLLRHTDNCQMKNGIINFDVITSFVMYGWVLMATFIFSAICTLIICHNKCLIRQIFYDTCLILQVVIILLGELFAVVWVVMMAIQLFDSDECHDVVYMYYVTVITIIIKYIGYCCVIYVRIK